MSRDARRRLAAIMFSDMVGYSALMQENEEDALTRRDRYRAVLEAAVAEHDGEILQHYGDGTLSVFASAVEAVRCAIDVQARLGGDRGVPLRIGLHSGDIVREQEGVYGDGVNIAARIQTLAAPGGVMISGKVYDEIKNQPDISAVGMGAVRLKNVRRPAQVFAVTTGDLPVPSAMETVPRDDPDLERETTRLGGTPPGAGEAFLEHAKEAALLQWAVVYVVGAAATLLMTNFWADVYGWPSLVPRALGLGAFLGFFMTLVVAWYHGERGRQPVRRSEVVVIGLLVSGGIVAFAALKSAAVDSEELRPLALGGLPADTRPSLAVLPFGNLSPEAENAYFASGLHDELLTQLQHIGGLRVISRSSVMEYADERPNIRQIATNLGVTHVIEGSVQRMGTRLRVNVSLTDARADENVWAQRYDRELDDAFQVQSDVAQNVASAMAARLTVEEQEAITLEPTSDPRAYRLYVRGREYLRRPGYRREDFVAAQQALDQAIALDSSFALAFAELSTLHGRMYWEAFDQSPRRLEAQRVAAEEARRLQPELAQTHVAFGLVHYVRGEFRRALTEYEVALEGLPNDAEVIARIGYAHRRLGEWPEAYEAFQKATNLDPRNATLFYDLGGHSFVATRRYREAAEAYGTAYSLAPDLYDAGIKKGETFIHWAGQLDTLQSVLAGIPEEIHLSEVDLARADLALWQRDGEEVLRVTRAMPGDVFESQVMYMPKALYEGWAHRLLGNEDAARAAFEAARERVAPLARERPADRRYLGSLGFAYAGLGEADRAADYAAAVTRSPQQSGAPASDSESHEVAARILGQAGLVEGAIMHLDSLLAGPAATSVRTLALDPLLDPIREDAAFQDLMRRYASDAP